MSSLPIDPADPVLAGAVWTHLAEPGDPAVRILQRVLGSEAALQWVFADEAGPVPEETIPWATCHERWHPRARALNLGQSLTELHRLGGRIIVPSSPDWPAQLGALEDREPQALWVLGAGNLGAHSVALVGARASSDYGNRVGATLARDLVSAGYPVISGGAYGIDAAAHWASVAAARPDGFAGVAVLCGGVGNRYPRSNEEMFQQLMKVGMLISEVPPHWRPARWRFLERNRIIAALSQVTVVVEAGVRSGALATANRALEQGRPVGAVPGPITSPTSSGCHQLLRDGAELIGSLDDVLNLLPGQGVGGESAGTTASPADLSPVARVVWDAFPRSGLAGVQQLGLAGGLGVSEVETALLEMQLRGLVGREGATWVRLEVQ
ncbi:DNA-processing protein DprA [Scrofimicrobium sp. R131]|uniref:DNA-processing protein DprA n=1 Tax=Scrofimicrobium appendicitidis TaxID=3079930 RepID=A0AAU7V907_9ACTO